MACNVCGRKLKVACINCKEDLDEKEFYCYDENEFLNGHFCSIQCWEEWIVKENKSSLEVAENDES